jgi:molybdate transport system substrate-binding protein
VHTPPVSIETGKMMNSLRRLALTLLLPLALTGGPPATAAETSAGQVRVAAASDLKFALDELVAAFGKTRPGAAVTLSYGSSGNFFSQISNGAPFDLFLSADIDYARRLAEAGHGRPEDVFRYGVGRIVLWVPAASRIAVERGLQALTSPEVRKIAIANPRHAPYGRAAEAALRSQGVYDAVKGKLVFGENVSQTAQFVQSGAADVGIIALALALAPPLSKEGRYVEVPLEAYPRLEQGGIVLGRARDPEAARALRDFLLGQEGRAILKRYGFSLPGE